MPTEQEYAERLFAAGLGRRAVFGCCADCGKTLQDLTQLVCKKCRRTQAEDPAFLEREAGHRERVSNLFSGVHDASLTFEKVNAIYARKRKAKGGKEQRAA